MRLVCKLRATVMVLYSYKLQFRRSNFFNSVKGGAHIRCIEASHIDATTQYMSPTLNESAVP